MPSPWVTRALEARKSGHKAAKPAEATLGDRVPADTDRQEVWLSWDAEQAELRGWLRQNYLSHIEHAARADVAVPCTAAHITFGGKCLNCGWSQE